MGELLVDSQGEENADVPECLACGTCCFSGSPVYLRVSGDDHARLGDDAERLVRFDGHRAYMRMDPAGHCAALVIDAKRGLFACSVYERRPTICRTLERGSAECDGERALKGHRPGDLVQLRLSRG